MLNQEMYHDIIEALAAALDAKDVYTAGHSTRVGNMAYELGKKLKLDDYTLQMIHIAGHLHDIGKIGVPDNVLNKKGKLDEHEWMQMKMHSEIGYNILKNTNSLKEIARIVLYHHEKWNGTGYPSKLSKNEIPLGSRIITLCDSIDAMRSKRPYKQVISNIDCYNEILKNKEIMYDPKITDCLIENWNVIVTPQYS
ncbi:HD-GYP domain-containing protein (c-di-GMP phosphodiesterase class II) [Clostridium saccharoperbutylacetonicum]|uniref:Metal dependent phosphohydrolase n=1 Tax=Clostridium saccharoperbutylacetonicum N1-4(HMT) TaxID=931276 RepID=M1MIA4_9CLOT|nr:HD-GYP domain-containing protein [Clostridium saccharoperbutylacetonicum]AGF57654.1 metal dependent phosphohydrolase [Clostridium saccharoperbutylacetonicum N1-4(HMT)]NRT61578.1 HD-GYP domain-containing protein (c-di-GMP phosphodiesterase class II) [Clostridium saccharoperbutylacetonicum]NSB24901.1 HD-GYP domain-containing protein (c-di-GMP phosphodiesterase class II) [Clostridium saccharoperbutylacetonicum]NSB44272.1 HD-GYP domain-containing protein (c-di-GMP phosphodiesterase class II) [Cl